MSKENKEIRKATRFYGDPITPEYARGLAYRKAGYLDKLYDTIYNASVNGGTILLQDYIDPSGQKELKDKGFEVYKNTGGGYTISWAKEAE